MNPVFIYIYIHGSSDSKESACDAGDPGSLLGLEMATRSSMLAQRIP